MKIPKFISLMLFCLISSLCFSQKKDSTQPLQTKDTLHPGQMSDTTNLPPKKPSKKSSAKKTVTPVQFNKDSAASDKGDTVISNGQPGFNSSQDYTGIYKWNDYVQIYPCTLTIGANGSTDYQSFGNVVSTDPNGEFYVQDVVPDYDGGDSDVIIRYLYYLKDGGFLKKGAVSYTNKSYFYRYNYAGREANFDKLDYTALNNREFGTMQKYFLVKRHIFLAHAVKVPAKIMTKGFLGFGIINYPFKYRYQKGMGDFSGSFNVGAAISYTFKHDSSNKWSVSGIFGVGISSINLDKSSVKTGADTLTATNGISALTLSLGIMAQYDKVQIGVFYGWDRISNLNNTTYGWKYQGKPWVSVGLGYSIFTTNASTQQSKSDTQPN